MNTNLADNIIRSDSALEVFRSEQVDYSDRLWQFFSFISLAEKDFLRKLYKKLDLITEDSWQKFLVRIGRAKFDSVQGRVFSSHISYIDTLLMIESNQQLFPDQSTLCELKAFLLYEKAILGTKIRNYTAAYESCSVSHKLTHNTNFSIATNLLLKRLGVVHLGYDLDTLLEAIREVEAAGLNPLACMGWRMAGIYARNRGLYAESKKHTGRALEISEKHNLSLLQKQIVLSQAVSASTWGQYEKARELISEVKLEGPDDVHRAIVNEILAVMEEEEEKVDNAVSLVKDALTITTELDHVTMVPDETLFLGEKYENHYNDLDQAEHYYRIGYEHAIRYAEHGISLTGERKQVVEAYLNVVRKKNKFSKTKASPAERLSFADGKSWKDIKDIFQHQLILYHSSESSNKKKMARQLRMPATTLYSLQTRLTERGYLLPEKGVESPDKIDAVQDYIDEHKALSWKEINEIFEREMMHYLYEKYGYNKQRMASVLKISYPALIGKTRQLTQMNENILPN